jgi:hypothetical protein
VLAVGVLVVVAAAGAIGCASGDDDEASSPDAPPSTAPTTTTTLPGTVVLGAEEPVSEQYRQGLARVDDGWIFSTNNALFRTDEQLQAVAQVLPAIPEEWAVQGYTHVGDIDVVGGVVYAPLERDDKTIGEQAMARFDAETLAFVDATPVPQHHASFVAVDPETMTAYSMDYFGGDAIARYDASDGFEPLDPLPLSTFVDRVQGADLFGEALWLSTDDPRDGVYRVDLDTGEVTEVGSLGRIDGEAEGIDATRLDSGFLHALTIDVALRPVWFVHLLPG